MASSNNPRQPHSPDVDERTLRELLGYLNLSGGKPDAAFQRNFNRIQAGFGLGRSLSQFRDMLLDRLAGLADTSQAFADRSQAEAVIRLACEHCLPAYQKYHADLLFHLGEEHFRHPYLLVRIFEAVLRQGPPWDETSRIVGGAISELNDFIGYRPLAALQDGRQMEPYAHERFRPVPLFIRQAGPAAGPYRELVENTLAVLRSLPSEILSEAHFDLDQLDELALDVRAHDHTHPVNKRTNYMFGEWDPHCIDNQGRYRRFVVRKIILDSLRTWMATHDELDPQERLYDASAVFAGTILMASAISGSGPETHGSSVTLTSLLPKVAHQRDVFYETLLTAAHGSRARRLRQAARQTQQPFGQVRQQLNMELAAYGAKQVHHRHLAQLFALMGYPEASRGQATMIPCASARFETEVRWRLVTAQAHLDAARPAEALQLLQEVEDHLKRGIECGALVDPWNILGFQGQFPLFASREDSIPDHRVETLLEFMDHVFQVYSHACNEATVQGNRSLADSCSEKFRALADWWDRYATAVVEDLPVVVGYENWESSREVCRVLAAWRTAGEAAGDIGFWRTQAGRLQSAKAYALVVESVLNKGDHTAAMGLLMQWLSEAEDVGLGAGAHSVNRLLLKWMRLATAPLNEADGDQPANVRRVWSNVKRLFDYLEANAGELWFVPTLESALGTMPPTIEEGLTGGEPGEEDMAEDDEDSLFEAAYDSMIYRDSAADGFAGEMLDDGGFESTDLDLLARTLEPRLAFLQTLAQLWQMAGAALASQRFSALDGGGKESGDRGERNDEAAERVQQWQQRSAAATRDLGRLMDEVWRYRISKPGGGHEANVEYDMQLQTKFYLLHSITATEATFRQAMRHLGACQPRPAAADGISSRELQFLRVHRALFRRDVAQVRRLLPKVLQNFGKQPLLYVPFEHGGAPQPIREVRSAQTVFEFLLSQLPRLGLLHETWQVLRTAYRLERKSRPAGSAVTEFDRLFRIAIRTSLECIIKSSQHWKSGKFSDDELIEVVGEVVDRYLSLWLKHSDSVRLSSVEELKHGPLWRKVKQFIEHYGGDLLQARMLTLGNVRAVLHNGVDELLDHLAENHDPLHTVRLLEDIDSGRIDRKEAVKLLRLLYETVVDRFDRFVEYNTTTTQSDYGEKFYCLLDFLRVDVAYERDAWNLAPLVTAHEVLTRLGKTRAAEIWEQVVQAKTAETADEYLAQLQRLQRRHAMRLPSLIDRLNERFVKPLAVSRMLALVPLAVDDARRHRGDSSAFRQLQSEIDEYLQNTVGSGVEVPTWLQTVEQEVDRIVQSDESEGDEPTLQFEPAARYINLREMRRQLEVWNQQLSSKRSSD